MHKKPNGAVIYNGASQIDGQQVVIIATGLATGSTNRKTGDMIQTYILRADQSPIDAAKSGADESVCGKCPHRGMITETGTLDDLVGRSNINRTCYVNLGQGPLSVWRAWQRGAYPHMTANELPQVAWLIFGRFVRLGTYGDPAAAPTALWDKILALAAGHTGYTHQWRVRQDLAQYCMASVDDEHERDAAQALGWRTFRVATNDTRAQSEVVCPASAEAGKKLTCADCLACSGNATRRKGSIVIQAHGSSAVMSNFKKLTARAAWASLDV